jgi:hypothetical protein
LFEVLTLVWYLWSWYWTTADAFLANLDMSALDEAEGLGMLDDEDLKLDDNDLRDSGKACGGGGGSDGDE